MLRDDALILPSGPDGDPYKSSESMVGRILYERFLVERDITKPSRAGSISTYIVKDTGNFCRRAVLRSVKLQQQEAMAESSPSYRDLCEAIRQLGHPNIEEILETGSLFDGRPYSVSEFIEGESLDKLLEAGRRLSLELAARIIQGVSEALAAAHSRNILHCGVAPQNVIVSATDGSAKAVHLIDFGTAWPIDLRRDVEGGDDSLYYAAPEMLVKLNHRSPASDVYSLAALAYRMVAGDVPFRSRERAELLTMIGAGEIEPPSENRTDLGREAERIILAGLRPQAVGRPQDIEDFGSRLAASLCPPVFERWLLQAPLERPDEEKAILPEDSARPEEIELPNRLKTVPPKTAVVISDRTIAWSLIVLLLAGALTIPIGQTILGEEKKGSTIGSMVPRLPENNQRRQIKYAIGNSHAGSGKNSLLSASNFLKSGDQQLAVVSDTPGDLYILKESEDGSAFQLIYPSPGSPSAAVAAEKTVGTALADAEGLPSVKAVWLVWTGVKNEEIESFRKAAAGGAIPVEESRQLKHFLERNRDLRVETAGGETAGQTVLNGAGDRIVHRIDVGVLR